MVICPDCGEALGGLEVRTCVASCGWQGESRDGVPVFLSRADRQDPVLAEYLHNYDAVADEDLVRPILDDHYVLNQAANLVSYMGDLKGLEICDLGCGQGQLSKALLERGGPPHITAVDIALSYLRRLTAVPGVTPVLANAENLPFADAFDIVVTTDVMEHVLNVGSFLYALNRAIRKGGRAYIRVPYRENLLVYSPHLGCNYRFVHLRSFDKSLLRLYMRTAGFEVEGFRLDGFSIYTPREFWMRGLGRKPLYNKLQQAILNRLRHAADVTRWNSRVARLFMRPQEIVVIARKYKAIEKLPESGFSLT